MCENVGYRGVSGKNDGEDMKFPNPSGNELRVLRSKIQDDNRIVRVRHGNERLLI